MFDVGFSELVLIFLVGLVVFGPTRLPGLVKDVTHVVRRIRQGVNSAKSEIEREFQIIEMRDSLRAERQRVEKEINALQPMHPAQWLPRPPALEQSEPRSDSEPTDTPSTTEQR